MNVSWYLNKFVNKYWPNRYLYMYIGLLGRVFANVLEDGGPIPG